MNRILVIIGLVCAIGVAASAINSPVGPATTPQSSFGGNNDLTPNPSGKNINAGNDIVSGNVSGGKEFRGFVPYGSQYYFQGNQNNAEVQSFIRRSSGNPYGSDRAPQRTQTYISPYQAVTSLRGGRPITSQVYTPQSPISNATGVNEYGLVPLEEARKLMAPPQKPESQLSLDTIAPLQYGRFRPLTVSPEEKEPFITKEVEAKLYPTERKERELQKKEFKEQLEQVKENEEPITQPAEPTNQVEDQVAKPTVPGQQPAAQPQRVPGVFEEMRELAQKEKEKSLAKIAAERAQKQQEAKQPAEGEAAPEEQPGTYGGFGEIKPEIAKAIMGYSKTFAVESRDRFNELMKAAEEYLKDKKYYKAADAYTLAAIYQKDNPLPVAGKSHALFAAGEYMSSAYYLSRAIEIWPDYVRFKVDIYGLLDKDVVENRIAEVTSWQEKTNSPELLMLLGYIYYQTDRLEPAQMSVNGAKVKMPESQSLQMLDNVIRSAIAQQSQTK